MNNADLTAIIPIETPTLGDRSYLVHDGEVALVVDPQRDIDRVLDLARRRPACGSPHVFETHIHNDYVTGGLALAERTGAAYHVNAEDAVSYDRNPIRDGRRDRGGRAPDRPRDRHARPHLHAPVLRARGGRQPGRRVHRRLAAVRRHRSARPARPRPHRRAGPAAVRTPPTGSPTRCPTTPRSSRPTGSAASARPTQSEATESTIGAREAEQPGADPQRAGLRRRAARRPGRLPGLLRAHGARRTPPARASPTCPSPSGPTPSELRRRIEAGEWVVDLRTRTAFAAGHVPGTVNFGLDGSFATYLGWLIEWGTPLTLLGETEKDVAEAQRELVRIGIDRPDGRGHREARGLGRPASWARSPPRPSPSSPTCGTTARWSCSTSAGRRSSARRASRARVNIPIHELPRRVAEVPEGEVWVHCAGGYRASVAASFIAAAGRTPGRDRRHLRQRASGRTAPGRARGVTA